MILDKKPLALAEVKKYAGDLSEKKELDKYLKEFTTLSEKDALQMKEDLRALKNHKMKEEHVVKIADFVPKDAEELGKIFNEVSLAEEESNAILSITSKY
jgi:DNA-directed RNA polymerase subunit F